MRLQSIGRGSLAYSSLALAGIVLIGWWLVASRAAETGPAPDAGAALRHDSDQLVVPEQSPLRKTIATQQVVQQSVAVSFVLPAVVEADSAKLVKILPPIAGRIVSLNKRLGDAVAAGEVLFTIDSADFAQAASDARKAAAALELAKQNLTRQRDLAASDIAAKRDLEQAQNDFEQAASESARADARLAQLGARGANHRNGRLLEVTAPISGRVVDLAGAVGGYWNDATAAVMTVADLSIVYVTASAQEKDLGQLYVGQDASVVLDAYPEQNLTAKIRYVGEMLDSDTRTVKVRMLFDNRKGQLKPGMFAKTTFMEHPHPGIAIPMSAVIQSGFYSRAFVEVAPWRFEPRVLQLGPQVGDRVEVLSGLKAGDRVVVKDGVLLND